jgi:hypothetical protein
MKQKLFAFFIASFALLGVLAYAHGNNEHVRGVVTNITPQAITVQTTGSATTTLTITTKTTFKQGGKVAHLSDLKVGDRVVIDVPEKTKEALLVQIGTAAKTSATTKTQ